MTLVGLRFMETEAQRKHLERQDAENERSHKASEGIAWANVDVNRRQATVAEKRQAEDARHNVASENLTKRSQDLGFVQNIYGTNVASADKRWSTAVNANVDLMKNTNDNYTKQWTAAIKSNSKGLLGDIVTGVKALALSQGGDQLFMNPNAAQEGYRHANVIPGLNGTSIMDSAKYFGNSLANVWGQSVNNGSSGMVSLATGGLSTVARKALAKRDRKAPPSSRSR